MKTVWPCPKCRRKFTRKNQRHACGAGTRSDVLRGRSAALIALYDELEAFAKSLGPIEVVTRERYVLLRTTRIFADVVIMKDALRVAIHTNDRLDDPVFFKTGFDRKRWSHAAKISGQGELDRLKPYLRQACADSLA